MTAAAPSATPWDTVDQTLRRQVSTARAARGMSWDDVAAALAQRGWDITPGNLMTRHSRMSFRADELIVLLDVLGVAELTIRPTNTN